MCPKLSFTAFILCAFATQANAEENISLKHQHVDKAVLHVGQIDRSTAIHVETFSVADAKLGKAKHQDIAKQMARAVPHFLASN